MDIEQMIDDEIGAEGLPLTNEEMAALYLELEKLQMLRHGVFQDMEVEIHNNTKFKIKK